MTETGNHDGRMPQVMSEEHHRELEIGRILRQARSEQGLSLEEVQEATRIRERYLDALEKDNYEVLPAAVYVRGFLKTYANFLGLDGDELAEEVRRRQTPLLEDRRLYEPPKEDEFGDFDDADDDPRALTPVGLGALGRFIPVLTLALVAVAILVGLLYFIGRGSQSSQNEGGTPPPAKNADSKAGSNSDSKPKSGSPGNGEAPSKGSPSNAANADQNKPSEPSKSGSTAEGPSAPESLEVAISVQNGPSWLDIRADGNPVLAKVAYPGFSQTFKAKQKLTIATGNAGAVQVEVNGQKVGALGDMGEVLTKTYTLKSETGG